ncbi:MAG TPA: hypothetical protein VK993_16045 [Chthoniobacterales bacterium]|nr:hypothetical protein [Chthoniobacterales bacterium]
MSRGREDVSLQAEDEGPLLWLVSFAPPATVILKISRVRDEKSIPAER